MPNVGAESWENSFRADSLNVESHSIYEAQDSEDV